MGPGWKVQVIEHVLNIMIRKIFFTYSDGTCLLIIMIRKYFLLTQMGPGPKVQVIEYCSIQNGLARGVTWDMVDEFWEPASGCVT